MIRVHHGGKMGDILYALPALRALSRMKGEKIHLTTSGLCWQLVPLLWEQPYFAAVELDDTRAYETKDGIMTGWDFYQPGEGINLSLQPCMQTMADPSWTHIYMKLCGVEEVRDEDAMALPSLVNHRRWHSQIKVAVNGILQVLPKTVVVAPEVETLDAADPSIWVQVMSRLMDDCTVIVVGRSRTIDFSTALLAWKDGFKADRLVDLRGLTTVPSLARLIAEASGFIGAHSFPWHLARHSEVPAVCLQHWLDGLYRCKPVDTPFTWLEPEQWAEGVRILKEQALATV